jgi:hypothetical protein
VGCTIGFNDYYNGVELSTINRNVWSGSPTMALLNGADFCGTSSNPITLTFDQGATNLYNTSYWGANGAIENTGSCTYVLLFNRIGLHRFGHQHDDHDWPMRQNLFRQLELLRDPKIR